MATVDMPNRFQGALTLPSERERATLRWGSGLRGGGVPLQRRSPSGHGIHCEPTRAGLSPPPLDELATL